MNSPQPNLIPAPTYADLFRWARDFHGCQHKSTSHTGDPYLLRMTGNPPKPATVRLSNHPASATVKMDAYDQIAQRLSLPDFIEFLHWYIVDKFEGLKGQITP